MINLIELVDYWKNDGCTIKRGCYRGFKAITEDIKLENCFYHKDIIDAMFRQPYSNETKQYSNNFIPGKIYASDFDMGVMGMLTMTLDQTQIMVEIFLLGIMDGH